MEHRVAAANRSALMLPKGFQANPMRGSRAVLSISTPALESEFTARGLGSCSPGAIRKCC